MTHPRDGEPPFTSPPITAFASPLKLPKTRLPAGIESPSSSTSSLPYRRPNAASSHLFAATSTPGSRSVSTNGSVQAESNSIFAGTPLGSIQSSLSRDEDPRNVLLQAFVPHVAIHTSEDTDELTREKGFKQGLWQLLRPFGEHVSGKVTIRDSVGASRTCDDFAVRFVQLSDSVEALPGDASQKRANGRAVRLGGDIGAIEHLVDKHLQYGEEFSAEDTEDYMNFRDNVVKTDVQSPFFSLYMRRLLSSMPMVPQETLSHPVACVIAISSRNSNPIEALRRLYDDSSRGDKKLPVWVNGEYLRYYVLVHDEEKDDISKSMLLFEQMKRHFGLHCHLLRIRSSQCILTDDDAIPFPKCGWVSASEELLDIETGEMQEDVEEASLCIYESDATALRTFIREMVTQSVVPSMERCVSTWNDQIISRRRGVGGRILTMTKKWAGFGSRANSTATIPGAGSSNSYDSVNGYYRPDTQEALLRKLADYAFMLRDWKLAQTAYEFCRSDFNNDKAWIYHAAANEMAAVSTLMGNQNLSSKVRMETIDQMLETATYSYITRCGDSYGALRCLLLGMELLKLRGGSATDDAARWGARLLESKLVGPVGDALIKERIATCHATRKGTGSGRWGSRTRKSALWKVLAAHEWLGMGKYSQAGLRMREVRALYDLLPNADSLAHFQEAHTFVMDIEGELRAEFTVATQQDGSEDSANAKVEVDEESEALDVRSHRKSLMGASAPPLASLGTAPLASTLEEEKSRDESFV